MNRKVVVLTLCLLFVSLFAFAETIELKSGKTITGEIVERTDKYIKVDTGTGRDITYFLDEIETIRGESAVTASRINKDSMNRWGIGYRYRYVHPDDEDFKKGNGGNNNNLNVTYWVDRDLALELEVGHFQLKTDVGSKIDITSAHLAIQLIKDFDKIKPYFVAGIGFQHYKRNYVAESLNTGRDNSVSFKLGPGVEYYFDKNWAINLEAVYVYGDTGAKTTLDVYGWQFGGGIKYYF